MSNATPFGFRIVGACTGDRKLIDWPKAFAAYCSANAKAGVSNEGYLSAFTFGCDFRDHLQRTGSTRAYKGSCGALWCWWDIDRADDLVLALNDARTLCVQLGERFTVSDDSLLVFFSGSKGFHVGLPLWGFGPKPGPMFHRIARRFAEQVAEQAGIVIDTGVYDCVRAFRAPNSRHPKTGLHKRRLTVDELLYTGVDRIVELACEPEPFELAELGDGKCGFELPAAWNAATERVQNESKAMLKRRDAVVKGDVSAKLNSLTLHFLREGATTGDRHRLLFSASANLAECGAPLHLCHGLLSEPARDSGLPPSEVERQIRCGYEHGIKGGIA